MILLFLIFIYKYYFKLHGGLKKQLIFRKKEKKKCDN